jgi:hypothetical protein
MKPIFVACIVLLTCGYSNSYPVFGTKRYQRTNTAGSSVPIYNAQAPQYFDTSNTNYPQQYVYQSYPQQIQQPVQRISDYYYSPQRDYQYFGMPTYKGEYNRPSSYYYAYPITSYNDERVETNPLDDLHEEILQEHERERSQYDNWYQQQQPQLQPDNNDYTNAEFMRNLVMYNKQLDRMNNKQNLQNLNSYNDYGDYEEDPDNGEWYDTTSIKLNGYDNGRSPQKSQQTYQQTPQKFTSELDQDVSELKKLKTHHADTPSVAKQSRYDTAAQYESPALANQNQYDTQYYSPNKNWQQDTAGYNSYENTYEPEYDESDSDWINWERKRDIQPKKDIGIFGLSESNINRKPQVKNPQDNLRPTTKKPETSTQKVEKVSNELPTKSHKGQKEVVLPRPATPVRKPFTDPVMKMLEQKSNKQDSKTKKSARSPIYDTIAKIIDMEENLNHVSTLPLTYFSYQNT